MQPDVRKISYLLDGRFYRLATTEWGPPDAEPVVCVHGLTRQGRDFDALAEQLAGRFRVICPDLPGRGRSDWLGTPAQYQPPSYVQALSHLLAAIGRPVRWVGTSLGGICGMLLAAAENAPITKLVLNDIGPFIPEAALARIRAYVGRMPEFEDMDEASAYLRQVHAAFGDLDAREWRAMAEHSTRRLPDGRLALHYDPALAEPITGAEPQDLDLWPVWQRIRAPVLVLRGAESDLLLPETLEQMGTRARTHVVPGCGHAPALTDAATIGVIADFLGA